MPFTRIRRRVIASVKLRLKQRKIIYESSGMLKNRRLRALTYFAEREGLGIKFSELVKHLQQHPNGLKKLEDFAQGKRIAANFLKALAVVHNENVIRNLGGLILHLNKTDSRRIFAKFDGARLANQFRPIWNAAIVPDIIKICGVKNFLEFISHYGTGWCFNNEQTAKELGVALKIAGGENITKIFHQLSQHGEENAAATLSLLLRHIGGKKLALVVKSDKHWFIGGWLGDLILRTGEKKIGETINLCGAQKFRAALLKFGPQQLEKDLKSAWKKTAIQIKDGRYNPK